MKRRRPIAPVALAVGAALAGCGSSSGYGGSGDSASMSSGGSPATQADGTSLAVQKTDLGGVLVDSDGRTLYMFGKDKAGASSCAGACARNWPPAAAPAKPKAGSGVAQPKLDAIRRDDGSRQLAYAGHPLYRFTGDGHKGDLKGQGVDAFGGVWYVVAPSGAAITKAPSDNSSGSRGGYGGGGY
jgi:predicted lipoprotein with Yx(FWY)xxD motif